MITNTFYKALTLFLFATFFSLSSFAQEQTIEGKIVNEEGNGLAFATVSTDTKSSQTLSNVDGEFTITVTPSDKTLSFSYIGYQTLEVPIDSRNEWTITLTTGGMLDKVVVTALGITKEEKKIGYSTQTIQTDDMQEIVTSNVGNLFNGKVSGLTVNNPTGMFQKPELLLRGKEPIIIVDNVVVETDFFDFSQSNIESINVLKGVTASALYGSRGRNGAILITTKSPKKEGLHVTATQNTMVSAGFTVYPETQTDYGNGSYGQYAFWDGRDGGISDGDMIWGPKFNTGVKVPQWNSPIRNKETGETIPWWGDVKGTIYDNKELYERVPTDWEYHDNLNDFLGTGIISSTNFTVGYKGAKGSYSLSGDFIAQKDRVPNSKLTRGGLTFKSNTQLGEQVTLSSKFSYNKVYSPNYPRYGYGPRNHMYTLLIWMGDDVNGQELKDHMYVNGFEGYRQANWNYAWYNNVYFAANELNQEYNSDVLNGQLALSYNISNNLRFQLRTSAVNDDLFEDRESPKSYLNYGDPREGDYKTWNKAKLNFDSDALINYNTAFSDNLTLSANVGGSTFYKEYQQEYNATDGLVVPFLYSLNNSRGGYKANTYVEEVKINSLYMTADLGFQNTLFINLSARNDWNSTLPKENRSYFYPSASASFVLSSIVDLPKTIDYIKLFSSWAQVSDGLNPYQISSYYNTRDTYAGNPRLNYPSVITNEDIEPERSTSFEVGFNTSFKNGLVNVDATYYNLIDENQIIDLPISQASGFTSRKVNGNEYTTNGIELTIAAKPIETEKLTWNTMVNWSRKVQKLTEIYGDNEQFGNYRLNDRSDTRYATVWQKSADGQLILDNNGFPSKDPFPKNVGHENPNWRLGFNNTLAYDKFMLGLGIDGVWGGVIRSLSVEKMWWGGKHPNSTQYRDQEYETGQNVFVPKGVIITSGELVTDANGNVVSDTRQYTPNTKAVNWQSWSQNYPYRAAVVEEESETFANIFDRSFFKLRTLTLGYDATDWAKQKNVPISKVALTGYNLLTWKKAPIIDPDFGNDNSLQDPSSRYIGLSIDFKFN